MEQKNTYDEIVQLLVENGAIVSEKNKWGRTPLHDACEVGNEKVVVYLLDHGAEIEPQTSFYLAPIELARQHNHTNIVKLLAFRKAEKSEGRVGPTLKK